jgi:hypothetical protein
MSSSLWPSILDWTQRLTGLDPSRVDAARAELGTWNIPQLSRELAIRGDIDAAVGAFLLHRRIGELVQAGVPENKLRAKLRGDPDVWPAWAEIVAAGTLVEHFDQFSAGGIDLLYEPSKASGAHADYRLVVHDTQLGQDIEFKALGLSQDEIAFFKQAAGVLPKLCPDTGTLTLHLMLEDGVSLSDEQIERFKAQAADSPRDLPEHVRDLRGVVVVAHAGEQRYLERLRDRLVEALQQLPKTEEGWVAFWWTNGAPLDVVVDVMGTIDLPDHLAGVMFVGAGVAVPHSEIHYYTALASRDAKPHSSWTVQSFAKDELRRDFGQTVLERFESSSGVRPTLIAEPTLDRPRTLLFRDGSRPILPFNLLVDRDPSPEHAHWEEIPNDG